MSFSLFFWFFSLFFLLPFPFFLFLFFSFSFLFSFSFSSFFYFCFLPSLWWSYTVFLSALLHWSSVFFISFLFFQTKFVMRVWFRENATAEKGVSRERDLLLKNVDCKLKFVGKESHIESVSGSPLVYMISPPYEL